MAVMEIAVDARETRGDPLLVQMRTRGAHPPDARIAAQSLGWFYNRSAKDLYALAQDFDELDGTLKQWIAAASDLLGPCRFPARRRRVLANIRTNSRLSMARIGMLNKAVRKLDPELAWQLREEFTGDTVRGLTLSDFHSKLKQRVKAELAMRAEAEGAEPRQPRRPSVVFSFGADGMCHIAAVVSNKQAADLAAILDAIAKDLVQQHNQERVDDGQEDEREDAQEQRDTRMSEQRRHVRGLAFEELVVHAFVGGGGRWRQRNMTTVIAISAEDFAKVIQGHGHDVLVGSSDGSTLGAVELMTEVWHNPLISHRTMLQVRDEAGLVAAHELRSAEPLLWAMLKAEALCCSWPGCSVPADNCEYHHIDPWKNGGKSTYVNGAVLCRYHNGINDDDLAALMANGHPQAQLVLQMRRAQYRLRGFITRSARRVGLLNQRGVVLPNRKPQALRGTALMA